MMDMKEMETKHLINKGLASIQNPFFKGLVERQAYSLGENVTPIGVAFYIAPLVNATIRVGTQEEKIMMFTAMLNSSAYTEVPSTKRGCKGQSETILEQAVRNSINIRNRQKRTRDEGIAAVEKIILEEKLLDNKIILVQSPKELNKNLTGLVANQLMAKYQKPVLLLRNQLVVDESTGEIISDTLEGSGRGYDKSELRDFKDFLSYSRFFNYTEGHPNAFGAGIDSNKVDEFIEYSNKELENIDFQACYDVDFIYDCSNIKEQDILDIGSMKSLWGKGVDESYIAIRGIKVSKGNISLMSPDRNPTIKITIPNTNISIIKFGASKEEYDSLITEGCLEIDIVGTASLNEWNGKITPQILVKEYEIVSHKKYYF